MVFNNGNNIYKDLNQDTQILGHFVFSIQNVYTVKPDWKGLNGSGWTENREPKNESPLGVGVGSGGGGTVEG